MGCDSKPLRPRHRTVLSFSQHRTSWSSIITLFSLLRLGLPSYLFPSGFSTKTLYNYLFLMHTTCPAFLILLAFMARTILCEKYRSFSSSLCSFLHSPLTSSLLGPKYSTQTLFSNNFSLRSSLNISGQISYPYKTTSRIIFLYILVFKVLDRKLKDKMFCTEW